METINLSKKEREHLITILEELKIENPNKNMDINKIISFINDRKYGLLFERHIEQVDIDCEKNFLGFIEDIDKKIEIDKSLPYNFLLEGDNLHSLKLLEKTYIKNGKGLIDVIYIDPPYNTKNKDFIYNDKIIGEDDAYRHSKWLSFMETRLKIAYDLLKDEGLIFISIDDNEFANLKLLCDDIFGEENMLSTHHIQVRYAEKTFLDKSIAPIMEYVLIYTKDIKQINLNLPKEEYTDENFIYKITELTNGTSITYENGQEIKIFKDGEWKIEKVLANIKALKETWVSGTIYTKLSYGQVVKKYIEPRYKQDGLNCLYKVIGRGEDGLGYRYYVGPQKKKANRCKMYSGMPLDKVNDIQNGGAYKNIPISNYYDYSPDFGNIKHEGGIGFNSGKKPIKMLKEFVNYHPNKDAIVLDFFAGSGTTGHAIMELNQEDGGNRQFILCTNNENNICEEITYQRLKTVITGIRQDGSKYSNGLPNNLKYLKNNLIDKNDIEIEDKLLESVQCLIELENRIDIENTNSIQIVFNDEDLENIFTNIEEIKKIYLINDVLLSSQQKEIINKNNIEIVELLNHYYDFV